MPLPWTPRDQRVCSVNNLRTVLGDVEVASRCLTMTAVKNPLYSERVWLPLTVDATTDAGQTSVQKEL